MITEAHLISIFLNSFDKCLYVMSTHVRSYIYHMGSFFCFLFVFLAFDFCRFCVVIRVFSSPPQRPMTSDFEGFLYQILSITLFSYLILEKEPVFPFSLLSAKQGNYLGSDHNEIKISIKLYSPMISE